MTFDVEEMCEQVVDTTSVSSGCKLKRRRGSAVQKDRQPLDLTLDIKGLNKMIAIIPLFC